jgi:hypothetical protein
VGSLLLLLSVGCKKPKERALTKDQQREVADSVLAEVPSPKFPIGAIFDDKVELIGVDLSADKARPGGELTITWYWRAIQRIEGDWKVFVHFEQPGKRQILDHHPVRDLYPMKGWAAGQIVRDEQRFEVSADFKNGVASFYVGVFDELAWKQQQANVRMKVTNAAKMPMSGEDRVKVAAVTVEGATGKAGATSTPPPRYTVRTATGAPAIDGKLDDDAWRRAARTRAFRRPDGKPMDATRQASAQLLWDAEHLYVGFHVKDPDIVATHQGRDQRLWEQDVVEVYLDPGADGKDYIELQVSPTNQVFDAVFKSHRTPRWEEAAKTDLAVVSAVTVDGTANQADDADTGWTVEIAIPWGELPGGAAPKAGDVWRANLYRIDDAGARNMAFQGAWAPVGGDFHKLDGAGDLLFAAAEDAEPEEAPAEPAGPEGEGAPHGAPTP